MDPRSPRLPVLYRKILLRFLLMSVLVYGLYVVVLIAGRNELRRGVEDLARAETAFVANIVSDGIRSVIEATAQLVNNEDVIDLALTPDIDPGYVQVYRLQRVRMELSRIGGEHPYAGRIEILFPLLGRAVRRGLSADPTRILSITGDEYLRRYRRLAGATHPLSLGENSLDVVLLPIQEYGRIGDVYAPYFLIELQIRTDSIRRDLDRYLANQGGEYAIVQTGTGSVVVVSDGFDAMDGGVHTQPPEATRLLVREPLRDLGLDLLYSVDRDREGLALLRYQFWIIVVSLLTLFLVAVFAVVIRNLVVRPVIRLVDSFSAMEAGDFSVRLDFQRHDEFDYLYRSFNSMVEKTHDLIHRVYEQNLRLQQSELKQLQYQINPHFLHNSLYLIYRMARFSDIEGVEAMSRHLSGYYKYLTQTDTEVVPLEREAEHVANYLEIQRVRFTGQLEVSVGAVPDRFRTLPVPRLILQPIVENAYVHGVKSAEAGSRIDVRFEEREGLVCVIVEDDGRETTDEHIAEMRRLIEERDSAAPRMSGVRNVHRRLQLHFGNRSGVSVSHSALGGMRVELSIEEG
ncbi:MAG: histidine kinase [Spirochaetota bacterium]